MKKYLSFVALILFLSLSLSAQDESDKTFKVIVIKKSIDDNGKEITEKIIKEGDNIQEAMEALDLESDISIEEIEELIEEENNGEQKTVKKMIFISEKEESPHAQSEEMEVNVNIEKDGERNREVTVTTITDGKEKIMKWEDEGTIPKEIQELLDEMGIVIEEENDDQRNTVTAKYEGANKGAIKTEGLKEYTMTIEVDEEGELSASDIFRMQSEKKPRFGILMGGSEHNGAIVVEVMEGSIAEDAGIEKDDIILGVNETATNSPQELIEAVKSLEEGKIATFYILRDGESKKILARM